MESKPTLDIPYEMFTWKIENFSNFKKICSKTFSACGYPWKVFLQENRKYEGYLTIKLVVVDIENLSKGLSRDALFKFVVVDQLNGKQTVTREACHDFTAIDPHKSLLKVISLKELLDPNNGFVFNNTVVIEVGVFVKNDAAAVSSTPISSISALPVASSSEPVKSGEKVRKILKDYHLSRASASMTDVTPNFAQSNISGKVSSLVEFRDKGKTKSAVIHLSRASDGMTDVTPNFAQYNEYISGEASSGLVEFRGIGVTKLAFIPLLEDAFSRHPSLFEFLKNKRRSCSYREWALTILGQVLHFLKIKKMRDMDKEACDDLQSQWDELRDVGFDLTWLKPFVDTALLAKDVRSLRQKVAGLEKNLKTAESEMVEQVKILKEKVTSVDKDLEIAKENLVEAEKSFAEIDLDAIIGFGSR